MLRWSLIRIVHPVTRVMIMILIHSSNKKSLIQLVKVERSGFTKHHRDMALKTWLVLLLLPAMEIHSLSKRLQIGNTMINGLLQC